MNIRKIGLMIAKDEGDIINEVLQNLINCHGFQTIYLLCDKSTDDSIEPEFYSQIKTVPWETDWFETKRCDGWRQILLQKAIEEERIKFQRFIADIEREEGPGAVKDCLVKNVTWFFALQGDELYDKRFLIDDYIRYAESNNQTVLNAWTATHVMVNGNIDQYCVLYEEFAGWKYNVESSPIQYYIPYEHQRAFPHAINPFQVSEKRLLRIHKPFRTWEQAVRRFMDRQDSGWQDVAQQWKIIEEEKTILPISYSQHPVKIYYYPGWYQHYLREYSFNHFY